MLLIVGGTGYVGGYILEALDGDTPRSGIRVMSRDKASLAKLDALGYQTAAGDVTNLDDMRKAMEGVDQVIYLTAIIREVPSKGQTFDAVIGQGTENMVEAAREAGVSRIIFMSALGAEAKTTGYFRNKIRGEEAVKRSGIPYVIFRPSFLIGPGGEFVDLLKQLTMMPIVPVPGPGNYIVQPLYVRDMAKLFVMSLTDEKFTNQTFEVGGPEKFEYNDMLKQTLTARGKSGFLLHAPLFLVSPMVPLVEAVLPQLLTRDQFTMLLEGSSTKDNRVVEVSGLRMTPFREAIKIALKSPPPTTYAKARK